MRRLVFGEVTRESCCCFVNEGEEWRVGPFRGSLGREVSLKLEKMLRNITNASRQVAVFRCLHCFYCSKEF